KLAEEIRRPLVRPEVRILIRLGVLQQVPVVPTARPLEQTVLVVPFVRADDRSQRKVAIPIGAFRRSPFLKSKGVLRAGNTHGQQHGREGKQRKTFTHGFLPFYTGVSCESDREETGLCSLGGC